MTRKNIEPTEQKIKDFKTKEVYRYIDPKNNIDIKSKEVFKKSGVFIHYPFNKINGLPKYRSCKKIIYKGLPDELPRGFLKSWTRGYGFTTVYNSLVYPIIDKYEIAQIIVENNVSTRIEDKILYLNPVALNKIYPEISSLLTQHRLEKSLLVNKNLAMLLPSNYKKGNKKYVKDSLHNYITRNIDKNAVLSDKDVQSLFDLAATISQDAIITNQVNILKTREKIEEHFIEEVIKKFEILLKQKQNTTTLEKRWQTFFKKYSWIFSQLFSFPVLIFEDEAYVGGKNLQNQGGKFADFIYKNKLTNNVAFIEIKTHNTQILEKRSYRGNDVFSTSKDLSGAINQVLDQRDNLQKEFYKFKAKSKEEFQTYNSKCMIVAGNLTSLSDDQKKSFELNRTNSRDVEIITFDEVLEKIKGLESILSGAISS